MKSHRQNSPSPMRWITHAALVIALAIVIARLTTPDALRDPMQAAPGNQAVPPSPGPSTALVFDLLACLPALLVLLRRSIDKTFRLSMHWSHLLLFALAGFAVLSTAWSVDRFAAAVYSAHFFTGACLLWAMSQLVRSPDRFRLVCSVAFGLLLVLATRTLLYRYMDVPEHADFWNKNKEQILKDRDLSPDSFEAKQFEHKFLSGELLAFFNSANSVAAVAVLLFAACAGIGFQKVRDGESRNWLLLPGIAAMLLILILINARSKTSAGTPFVGIAALGLFVLLRIQHIPPRRIFLIGVGLSFFSMIAVVGHGLYHHGLFPGHFSNSLDFRWKYWVASMGIFREHPLFGVGWDNFGSYYLAHRLPEAAEGIKDPHNFLVHFFVELGIVGGLLCIAWLIRISYEITCRVSREIENPKPDSEVHRRAGSSVEDSGSSVYLRDRLGSRDEADNEVLSAKSVVVIVVVGMLISTAATTDFALQLGDLLTLLLVPVLYLLVLLMGTLAGSIQSEKTWLLDNRPAPWVFYGLVTGLGLFLLHNLIDFSWFETGPMFLFMTLLGAGLGIAMPVSSSSRSRAPALIASGVGSLLWLAAAGMFVVPVIMAEQSAIDANELIRTAPASNDVQAIAHFQHAADDLQTACKLIPYNADYAYRQADVRIRLSDFARAQLLLADAERINPRQIDAYLLDANIRLHMPNPDAAAIHGDFATIIQLDPNSVSLRIQYGQTLQQLGLMSEAREQYRRALQADNALPQGEPTRLSADQVADLNVKAAGN